ncbi:MAG: RloB family protein [Patescibacteria group bacterium]|nr:RloB family protein [Patescibacteria group bacterium]
MAKYRGKKQHRPVHPKIFIWSHTEKAEIEYFQEYKNYLRTPLLMPKKVLCWTPQELIEKVIEWKNKNVCDEDDDQVWCIFDVDDFYKNDKQGFLEAVKSAHENNIKIAYANECFELWVLLHFEKPTTPVERGENIESRIIKHYKKNNLRNFEKNQKVFNDLLVFQEQALKNASKLMPVEYNKINWKNAVSKKGNPGTSIHFLIKEIKKY